ncbi:hypothetical protein H3023_gp11 [Bacillus phage Gxv1]|uniref:Uncharacterized protein n=1 Tax=Bacillus phage Gxv1 TaxID=2736266 RepID=A0A6M9Z6F3_9CAUD|nr:hypothetical protein H3023_gp11 [Bacillus phage Gxv1]QKN88703.1 hypothetical protein [Bacillus phage Gxv1]
MILTIILTQSITISNLSTLLLYHPVQQFSTLFYKMLDKVLQGFNKRLLSTLSI